MPAIPAMVAGLLFLAALRIGPENALSAMTGLGQTLGLVLILQLALPLGLLALLAALGVLNSVFAVALLMIAMSPAIAGSPNMVLMMGYDPAVAMRYLIVGTALLPLTVVPILIGLPTLGSIGAVIFAALRLLIVILAAAGLAFLVRHVFLRNPPHEQLRVIDGASALLLAVIVVGLMSAVNESMRSTPIEFWLWVGFVFAVNFGFQIVAFFALRQRKDRDNLAALTVIAGNRNIALFFVALPAEVLAPLLVFIGCYQVPMYLTPLITSRILQMRRK